MANRKIIGFLFCLRTNRARNRTAIRRAIRTRVDSPLVLTPEGIGVPTLGREIQNQADLEWDKSKNIYIARPSCAR
jgi:hypothetical protein